MNPNNVERTIDAKLILFHFWSGLRDAMRSIGPAVTLMSQTRKLLRLFAQCFALNGIFFLLPMIFFDYGIKYMIPEGSGSLWIFFIFRSVLWAYPLFALSMIANAVWYSEITSIASTIVHEKKERRKRAKLREKGLPVEEKKQAPSALSLRRGAVDKIVDSIYLQILLFVFVGLQFVLYYIPTFLGFKLIGRFLELFTYAIYASYVCFQYTWNFKGDKNAEQQLEYVERHWPYFLGFGIIPAISTLYFSFFFNAGIYAMLLPVYIVLALLSNPPPVTRRGIPFIHVFTVSQKISGWLISLIGYLISPKKAQKEVQFVENKDM